MKYLRHAILLIFLVSGNAFAAVLWDTGAPIDGSTSCDADCSLGEELLAEFTVTENWNITGLTFYSGSGDPALPLNYISTEWRISTGTPSSLTNIFSGIASATITDLGGALWQFDIEGLSLNLAPGTFWLGHHHDFGKKTLTEGAVSSNSGSFIQYWHNGEFIEEESGELARKITGNIVRSVPEPEILGIFIFGLVGLSLVRRKKS